MFSDEERTQHVNDTIPQVTGASVTGAKGVLSHLDTRLDQLYILDILRRMFLPAGFPNTVSPGAWSFHNKHNKHLTWAVSQITCSSLSS